MKVTRNYAWNETGVLIVLETVRIVRLTNCGRVTLYGTHYLVDIVSANGLSPVSRHAITWTNTDLSMIGPIGTSFSENRIKIQTLF